MSRINRSFMQCYYFRQYFRRSIIFFFTSSVLESPIFLWSSSLGKGGQWRRGYRSSLCWRFSVVMITDSIRFSGTNKWNYELIKPRILYCYVHFTLYTSPTPIVSFIMRCDVMLRDVMYVNLDHVTDHTFFQVDHS